VTGTTFETGNGGLQNSPFNSDPGYAAALAAEQLGLPRIDNDTNNLIAQRIVAYGDPNLATMAGFGLDPQSAAFARQNYLSGNGTLARLDKAHAQARQAIINQLAAHGLIDSGETGYQEGNADQTYGNQVYDAQQQALADILGYRNAAQQQRDALHNASIAALENAFQIMSQNPQAYASSQTQPTSADYGTSKGAQGRAGEGVGGATNSDPYYSGVGSPVQHAVATALTNPYSSGKKKRG
jgi:hypothetical protein